MTATDPPPYLTLEGITSALRTERADTVAEIKRDQQTRDDANTRIKANRIRLGDIDRMLAAAKPRARKLATKTVADG